MIFSKDKKPTEPGWWWFLPTVGRNPEPLPILVINSGRFRSSGCDLWFEFYGGAYDAEKPCSVGMFGDHILIPEAEVSTQDTKEGA